MDYPNFLIWGLLAAAAICALQAVRARHLLPAALWLASTSALTSVLLYSLGAHQAAIVELSVGAGLVFILFIFAISLAGEAGHPNRSALPRPVAGCGVALIVLLLGELAWPRLPGAAAVTAVSLSTSLWADRQLDVMVQIVLVFAGALTMMGLLAQGTPTIVDRPTSMTASSDSVLDEPLPAGGQAALKATGTTVNGGTAEPTRMREEALP